MELAVQAAAPSAAAAAAASLETQAHQQRLSSPGKRQASAVRLAAAAGENQLQRAKRLPTSLRMARQATIQHLVAHQPRLTGLQCR